MIDKGARRRKRRGGEWEQEEEERGFITRKWSGIYDYKGQLNKFKICETGRQK